MQELIDGLLLYHGSYCEVKQPDLLEGAKYKDFGQGFYITSSKKQAENFIRASVKKAALSGKINTLQRYGFVSTFQFVFKDKLNVLTYPKADRDWLHCVVGHRKRNSFPEIVKKMKQYDIIVGKIANDDTNATIAAYMASVYGKIGTRSADEMCISLLLPERLQDQFCFRTNKALKNISFVGSEKVWL